ncbi:MAG: beta-lactamase family protein [Lentisphaeria bacterium]|nr:beta-lactamase family protein [Lentisphaeria bacterium]
MLSRDAVTAILEAGIRAASWPGGVFLVVDASGCLLELPFGHPTYAGERRVRRSDVFDLASLTKVVATTSLAMRLHDAGLLDLDQPLAEILPEFATAVPDQRRERHRVTFRHLLAHASGLPAYAPLHREDCPPATRRAHVLALPLQDPPARRAVYSDIGMILTGFALERIAGENLHRLSRDWVFRPLRMPWTRYRPPPSWLPRILPTECSRPDGRAWQGVVHDENARWLGGVAGHAGLFACARDLGRFARMLLGGGELGGSRFVTPDVLRAFTRPAQIVPDSSRCLGWDSPSEGCSGGRHLGSRSFGHTGFTGTSLWIDPDAGVAAILLTNAVHPHREQRTRNGFFDRRRQLHDALFGQLRATADTGRAPEDPAPRP